MATPKNIARTAFALIATGRATTVPALAQRIRISKDAARAVVDDLLTPRGTYTASALATTKASDGTLAVVVLPLDQHAEADRELVLQMLQEPTDKAAKAYYDVRTGTKPVKKTHKAEPKTTAANNAPTAKTDEAVQLAQPDTREAWLMRAVPRLGAMLAEKAVDAQGKALMVPADLMVSVGFVRNSKSAIGVCIDAQGSVDDKTRHILVCPTQGDAVRVLDILLHELIHACLGTAHGHDKVFAAAARAVGLEGKPTATIAGEALKAELTALAAQLGTYPHVAVKSRPSIAKPEKGKSEWLRVYSPTIEGYCVNVRRDMLTEYGAPVDPNGDEMVEEKLW